MAADESWSTAPAPGTSGSEPPPVPPQKPLPFDCCESGCDRCVYEIYADELDHYQSELAAWRARTGVRDPHLG